MKREIGNLRVFALKMGGGKGLVGSLLELLVGRNSRDVSGVLGEDWVLALRRPDYFT